MRCQVIQDRHPKKGYLTVARCAHVEDAILFAAALIWQKPFRGCVQVRGEGNAHGLCFLVVAQPGLHAHADIAKALAGWRQEEKNWAEKQRAKKRDEAARTSLFERLYTASGPLWELLTGDAVFRAAYCASPPRIEEALARAAELGISDNAGGEAPRQREEPAMAGGVL